MIRPRAGRISPWGALLLSPLLTGCLLRGEGADTILVNGAIHTMDADLGTVEALAIQGDRILAAGSRAEIEAWRTDATQVMDLAGGTVVPGFIESHGHFQGLGESLQILDLRQARSYEDLVAQVAAAVQDTAPGEWILGRGWHQEKWEVPPSPEVEGFPVHDALSAVSPDHPVALTHASGHATFFNARAMTLAGVDAATPDPPGGNILHGPDGAPTGLFRETAAGLVSRARGAAQAAQSADQREQERRRALRLAAEECLAKGVTSFQDAGSSFATIRTLRDLAEEGSLGLRLWVMVREPNDRLREHLAEHLMEGVGQEHLTVRAIKRTLDGALGSRGAWLLQPYSDAPGSTGLNTATLEDVRETARIAVEHGVQLCIHAIGDRANREVLDLYEEVIRAHPDRDLRWRVEHAQHLHPADIPRFAELGVVASMQGIHCTSDAPYVPQRLGEQRAAEGAYVWRALLDSGALVCNGTDAPVEDVDPIACYHATVTRRMADGRPFHPEQAMTRYEALRSYTVDAARAAFQEDQKGSLTPGRLADLVLLSQDLLTVPEERLRDTRVLWTMVGGEVRYRAGGATP